MPKLVSRTMGFTMAMQFRPSTEHLLAECPHPRDQRRISENKAKYAASRNRERERGRGFRSHKWRLPEPGEDNRRVIDGKPYTFDPNKGRSGRWVENVTPSDGQPAGGSIADASAPPSLVNLGSVANLQSAFDAFLTMRSAQSTTDSGPTPPSDASTIATQQTSTTDPVERRLQLHLLRAKIDAEIDRS